MLHYFMFMNDYSVACPKLLFHNVRYDLLDILVLYDTLKKPYKIIIDFLFIFRKFNLKSNHFAKQFGQINILFIQLRKKVFNLKYQNITLIKMLRKLLIFQVLKLSHPISELNTNNI